jgi:hypothetical protein
MADGRLDMSYVVRAGAVRATAVAVLAGLCIAAWSPIAIAGGAETLELRERAAAVGSTVVARSTFVGRLRGLPSLLDHPTPADGPFYGYLFPSGPPWRSIEPPRIPG